jgi:hypothetical protein
MPNAGIQHSFRVDEPLSRKNASAINPIASRGSIRIHKLVEKMSELKRCQAWLERDDGSTGTSREPALRCGMVNDRRSSVANRVEVGEVTHVDASYIRGCGTEERRVAKDRILDIRPGKVTIHEFAVGEIGAPE